MLETLRRIIQEVNVAADLSSGLQATAVRIREAMQTDVVSLYLLNNKENRYRLVASEGLNATAVGNATMGVAEGLVGQVGVREEPLNVENAAEHPKYHYLQGTGEERYLSFLGVPIIHYKQLLGVLVVQQKEARRFDESEEAFVVTLCAQLAGVISLASTTKEAQLPNQTRAVSHKGIAGAPGVGIGAAVVYFQTADIEAIPQREAANIEQEVERVQFALAAVRTDISRLAKSIEGSLGAEELALFTVYQRMLDDASLGGEIIAEVEKGEWAEGALAKVIREHVRNFELMEDAYLRERAADVKDLGLRVLAKLEEGKVEETRHYPEKTVLVGEEITASMLAEVPRECLAAVVSVQGALNSHMAIVARSMGVPTVVGVLTLPVYQLENKPLIVDGYRGEVISCPSDEMLKEYRGIEKEEQTMLAALDKLVDQEAVTPDGVKVQLWVNTGLLSEIPDAIRSSVSGVGLYRSEVPFMMRDRFPSEEEQAAIYRKQLEAFAPHPVTMRTLDIGGDKRLPYFPIFEENPALGWRGIRITLDHPEIFMLQVRSMLRASTGLDNLKLLLPMISTVFEVEEALHLIHRAYYEVVESGYVIKMPKVGVMIEVPAAIYQIRDLANRVDFISVGSNDLAQYLLAVDRNNPRVAGLYNTFHPAMLHALQAIVKGGRAEGKPVSICGEMAGDPGAALLLVAMGYTDLSMSAANLLKVKSAICKVPIKSVQVILEDILSMDNAEVIHSYLDLALEQEGLSSFLRPRYRR